MRRETAVFEGYMQLEKTVEIQASLWYLSTDLTLFFFFFNFFFECMVYYPSFFFEYMKGVFVALDYIGTWRHIINPLSHSPPLGPCSTLRKILELTSFAPKFVRVTRYNYQGNIALFH